MSSQNPQQPNIPIQASEEIQRGFYSNVARIAHTPEEFVMDYLFITNDPPFGKLGARILISPMHAKRLLAALADNLQKYESRFGEIKVSAGPEIPSALH